MSWPSTARHAVLSEISPFGDDSDIRVVIETPRGSRSKYSYDPECDCMQLSTVLPEGLVFPYDFGFVPSTLGGDGDPLDILVLMEASVIPGCVVPHEAYWRDRGGAEGKGRELDAQRPPDRGRDACPDS